MTISCANNNHIPAYTGRFGTVVMLNETCIAAITKMTRELTGIDSIAAMLDKKTWVLTQLQPGIVGAYDYEREKDHQTTLHLRVSRP